MPSLSQVHRPARFADITGQQHITETLRKEVATGKLGHAYLFCGPRGVGKTTSARVFAKALLCSMPVEGEPCNTCPSCVAFAANKHLDVIELDAATHTGVDNVREAIVERVRFAPSLSKRKVFILDEVHMFSASSWNALLKTLEEPPAHAFFILATTEWHKVPATIISRCQRFEFKRVANDILSARINELAAKEGWQIDAAVVSRIVASSDGCVRDAETLLGQVGALGQSHITEEIAGLVIPPSHVPLAAGLVKLWVDKKHTEALAESQRLFDEGLPMVPLFDDLLTIARRLLASSGTTAFVADTEDDRAIAPLVGRFTPGELHDLSLLLLERRKDVKAGVDPLFALQLVGTMAANGLLRHASSGARGPELVEGRTPPVAAKSPVPTPAPAPTPVVAAPTPEDLEPRYEDIPMVVEATIPTVSAATNTPPPGNLTIETIRMQWHTIVGKIEEKNHSLPFILKLSRPESLNGSTLVIRFQYPFHRDKIITDMKHRRLLEETIQEHLGHHLAVEGVIGEEHKEAEARSGDMVNSILKAFGGQVVE